MKRFILLFVCLALLISVVACGQPGTSTTASTTEPIKLTFIYFGGPAEKDVVAKAADEFNKKYAGKIECAATHVPDAEYDVKLQALIAANQAPDLSYLGEAEGMEMAVAGKVLDLTPFIEADTDYYVKPENIISTVNLTFDNGKKTLGGGMAVVGEVLIYNKDLFTKNNIELPPTNVADAWEWNKFIEICKKLTVDNNGKHPGEAGFDPNNIKSYALQFNSWWGTYLTFLASNGGGIFDENGKCIIASPESIDAIQKVADLIHKEYVCVSPLDNTTVKGSLGTVLMTGQVAMSINGTWNLIDMRDVDFTLGVGVLPKLKYSKTVSWCPPIVIYKTTPYPNESYEFWKWYHNPENVITLYQEGLWNPPVKDWLQKPDLLAKWVDNDVHPEGYKEAVCDYFIDYSSYVPALEYKNYVQMDNIINAALESIWSGENTAEEALKGIESQIQELYAGKY